jgi:nicotinate-nucleotide adenylyltransferase
MRLGLFGGTFDPPHYGHLQLAQAARQQLSLNKVLWIVTADPPHKQGNPISPITDRVAMVLAMLANSPTDELSRVDIDRPGPHYSAETVALLAQQFPAAELIFLMGGDSLRDLPTWHRPLDLLKYCSLGVLRRPGDSIDSTLLAELEHTLPGITAKVSFVEAPPVNIASHDLRQRVRAGASPAGLIPAAVEAIIRERGLYQKDEAIDA